MHAYRFHTHSSKEALTPVNRDEENGRDYCNYPLEVI